MNCLKKHSLPPHHPKYDWLSIHACIIDIPLKIKSSHHFQLKLSEIINRTMKFCFYDLFMHLTGKKNDDVNLSSIF